jgi:hypothetical protein
MQKERRMSELITNEQRTQMVENFRANATQHQAGETTFDFRPVVKLFKPKGRATWLLTEYDPDFGILFGLCDRGFGFPQIGNVALEELQPVIGAHGIRADVTFQATKTLSEYAADARRDGCITA